MPGWLKKTLACLLGLPLVLIALVAVLQWLLFNPRVEEELRADPAGPRTDTVLLLTFADDRTIPVNYLREGNRVYLGADGPWWRSFDGDGQQVRLWIKGQVLAGRALAVRDDPALTDDVFARLRPTAPGWLPDWLNGVLVVIELSPEAS